MTHTVLHKQFPPLCGTSLCAIPTQFLFGKQAKTPSELVVTNTQDIIPEVESSTDSTDGPVIIIADIQQHMIEMRSTNHIMSNRLYRVCMPQKSTRQDSW